MHKPCAWYIDFPRVSCFASSHREDTHCMTPNILSSTLEWKSNIKTYIVFAFFQNQLVLIIRQREVIYISTFCWTSLWGNTARLRLEHLSNANMIQSDDASHATSHDDPQFKVVSSFSHPYCLKGLPNHHSRILLPGYQNWSPPQIRTGSHQKTEQRMFFLLQLKKVNLLLDFTSTQSSQSSPSSSLSQLGMLLPPPKTRAGCSVSFTLQDLCSPRTLKSAGKILANSSHIRHGL